MNIHPKHNRVFIQKINVEQKTASSIIIPVTDAAESDMVFGMVVAAGPGTYSNDGTLIPVQVQVGEIVIFKPNAGLLFAFKDQHYYIFRDNEIAASLTDVSVATDIPNVDPSDFLTKIRELG